MDAAQFQQFMQMMQNMMQQSKTIPSTPVINVANIPPFEVFNPKQEDFRLYIERFENYLKMKELYADKKKAAQMLVTSIGSSNYNTLAALVAPQKPTDIEYDKLISILGKHLSPERNMLVAQHLFLSEVQSNKQSITEYVATLQQNLSACKFRYKCTCEVDVSIADVFLRAQFIRGLKDSWITEQILQSDLIDFNQIVQKAIALEAARADSKTITKADASTSSIHSTQIDKVSTQRHSRGKSNSMQNRSRSKSSFRNRSASSNQNQGTNRDNFNRQTNIDYRELGIDNLCFRCGRDNHRANECYANRDNLKCKHCNKSGHVAKVCVTTLLRNKNSFKSVNTNSINQVTSSYDSNQVIDVFDNKCEPDRDARKYFISVSVEGHNLTFEVDSCAGFTLIPKYLFDKLGINCKLDQANVLFRAYTHQIFRPYGKITVNVQYRNSRSTEDMYVVPNHLDPLLGRVWIRHLKINLEEVDADSFHNNSCPINKITNVNDIRTQFSKIFEQRIGLIPNVTISLTLRENSKPVYVPERNLPYALQEKVEHELNLLEEQGIISKCPKSDWGSPLVVVPKPDGKVRLCVDYKIAVNDCLVNVNYPIKRIDTVLNSLRNSKFFCRLDLFKAYLHLKVDDASSSIQTISTHRGTFKMNRLSFGIKTAPAEFNRIIDQILQGLPKTISYFDDILVHGSTYEECAENLFQCLQRLQENDLHLNENKCSFFKDEVDYLGYVVRFNQISKDPKKIDAIKNMPRPKNVADVRTFLGMITYYSRLLPDLSTMTAPLRKLLTKNANFYWSSQCESAFIKLKGEITSDRVVVPFEPTCPVILSTDASPYGIAAVLSHVENDDLEKPIAFASRSLTQAEQNYSQLDREALAIIFGVSHFQQYLIGRNFTLITDNQPLARIFHPKAKTSKTTSARLIRYASYLSSFDFNIQVKRGVENQNADCLSRAPIKSKNSMSFDALQNEEMHEVYEMTIFDISTDTINSDRIREETCKDRELQEIIEELSSTSKDSSFTIDHGILFRDQRVVIPKSMQNEILQELHVTHLGVTKMKQLSRRYCFWKGIDKDIESFVKACPECIKIKHSPSKVPLHHWEMPNENWDRIHIDYAGPIGNQHFLVVVDAKSKWAEVRVLNDSPNSLNSIELLNGIFSTHGYPKQIVSDNATIFTSKQFSHYCRDHGIRQKFIAPGHPATNGLAERNVQTLKRRLESMRNEKSSISVKLQTILLRYRATPLIDGKSPAENYLHRRVRIRLDAIRPYFEGSSSSATPPVRSLQEKERVIAKCFANNKIIWKPGTVLKKFGKLHYLVELDDGYKFKRHIDQLQKSGLKSVKFQDPPEPRCQKQDEEDTSKGLHFPQDEHSHYQTMLDATRQDVPVLDTPVPDVQVSVPELRRSKRDIRPPAKLTDYVLQ
ncbi:uncharacterized protein K02A2.6-like [Photinus pyralis]|uniref:uncharacterized protein K02A2.6-like n=1 Tax=Photinus pyralis TaxID=7054 RepID=UPI001267530C|nr:uncharacterized protein K02A2.6-like [Photinus pyralis]